MSKIILLINSSPFNNQKGVTAVLIALMLPVLIGVSALAIDVGYMYTKQNELQHIADAAALAACGELGDIYINKDYSSHGDTIDTIETAAIESAIGYVAVVDGTQEQISIDSDDIVISNWPWTDDDSRYDLDPNKVELEEDLDNPDCVRVTVRGVRTKTFFAGIFSLFDDFESSATATAVLSGRTTICQGKLTAPVGVSLLHMGKYHLASCNSGIEITLNPAMDDCAGWHNFFDPAIDPDDMKDKALALIAGHSGGTAWLADHFGISPAPTDTAETRTGNFFNFRGGNIPDLFEGGRIIFSGVDNDVAGSVDERDFGPNNPAPFIALFDFFRTRDNDGDNKIWTATIPVYDDSATCTNPNGSTGVIGFTKMEINMPFAVLDPDDNSVNMKIICDRIVLYDCDGPEFARGAGGIYGNAKGYVPNLVQSGKLID